MSTLDDVNALLDEQLMDEQFDLASVTTRLEHLMAAAVSCQSIADEVRGDLQRLARTHNNKKLAAASTAVESAHKKIVEAVQLLKRADQETAQVD